MSERRGRREPGRIVVLLVLVAVLTAGVVLERRDPGRASTRVGAAVADGPVVPANDPVSTAWYCALGGDAGETVFVANLAPRVIHATASVLRGADGEDFTRTVRIAAYGRAELRLADLVDAPGAGVLVEVLGGPAIVEHEIRGEDDVAMGPCADEPARRWFFAAGGTAGGATQTIELLNPFDEDAVVDVTFLTDDGAQEPQSLQGFVVGRRSKVAVPVHELVPRQERIATVVRTRLGRVVAEQVRTFDGSEGERGVALTMGAARPRHEWVLPVAAPESRGPGILSLANFGVAAATVEVSVHLGGGASLAPETVVVPSRSVVHVDPIERVPLGSAFAVVVRALGPTSIVADMLLSAEGVAATGSVSGAARRWALAGGPPGTSSAVVAVNRASRPLTVELRAYTRGDTDSPRSAPALNVAAGSVVRFDLDEWGIEPDQVLVVSADGPIVVGRETFAGGTSLSVAVPFGS